MVVIYNVTYSTNDTYFIGLMFCYQLWSCRRNVENCRTCLLCKCTCTYCSYRSQVLVPINVSLLSTQNVNRNDSRKRCRFSVT